MSVSVAAYRKALKERTRERVSQPAANALMTLAMFARSRQRYAARVTRPTVWMSPKNIVFSSVPDWFTPSKEVGLVS